MRNVDESSCCVEGRRQVLVSNYGTSSRGAFRGICDCFVTRGGSREERENFPPASHAVRKLNFERHCLACGGRGDALPLETGHSPGRRARQVELPVSPPVCRASERVERRVSAVSGFRPKPPRFEFSPRRFFSVRLFRRSDSPLFSSPALFVRRNGRGRPVKPRVQLGVMAKSDEPETEGKAAQKTERSFLALNADRAEKGRAVRGRRASVTPDSRRRAGV